MKRLKQLFTAIRIEYYWKKINIFEKKEVLLKNMLRKAAVKNYLCRKQAERLSIYYETISGLRSSAVSDNADFPKAA